MRGELLWSKCYVSELTSCYMASALEEVVLYRQVGTMYYVFSFISSLGMVFY